ncbi:putative ABC transport system ATP-binding protein [Clostridium amylolyticum]|uniref:Putative ABC transport system ATP-binding protein n=1 Tax=Clostridium amylolyticum TaxID=1121298 RepID=A0A1M6ISE8_9CLOT|nr:ABC transporter ATP-binding protein [Clostridium amylolyticum]SHJ37391.1 putative ABC transport system ATP-binding protein [Clostridium amylolyticum]
MFSIKGLVYKDILAINRLELLGNKIICIVGESGGGKTTLLKMLNKLVSPDKGEILYNNISLKDIDSVNLRREVVMLSQIPAIFEGTIKDNLLIGLKFSEKPMVSDKVLEEALSFIKLNKNLEDNSENLSGGEKQRLALARVLIMNPKVFLLDEPSSALDEDTEKFVIEKLVNHTRKNNKTLIMVTHSKSIAENYYDCLIEIKEGKIINIKEVK